MTKDARFVTARHCLQAIWKVGVTGREQQGLLRKRLEDRFQECASEKNCALIRFDIIQGFRHLYDKIKDKNIKAKALELIEIEDDIKYRKKHARLWKAGKPGLQPVPVSSGTFVSAEPAC